MHLHAYSWLGEKELFDHETLRRLPDRPLPPVTPEDEEHYRTLLDTFRRSELPPMETAHWLLKTPTLIRATFHDPKDAATWLGQQLTAHAPGFLSREEANTARLSRLLATTTTRLTQGADISLGFYTGHTSFLSLAVVTCAPNATSPDLPCPQLSPPTQAN